MSEAQIIPFGEGPGRRRRTGADAAASAVAAGAARASGERARRQRRTTPLLAGQAPEAAAPEAPEPGSAAVAGTRNRAVRSERQTEIETETETEAGSESEGTVPPLDARPEAAALPPDDLPPDDLPPHDLPPHDLPPHDLPPHDLPPHDLPTHDLPSAVLDRVTELVAMLRRRLAGEVEVDEYGFDVELTEQVLLPALRPLYQHWFRVEVRGIQNIPAEGGCLVVANHSGTLPFDALMTQLAVHDEHPQHRHLRMLGADLVFSTPFLGELARKSGATLASNADAERMLAGGEVVGVWPEGFKGIGKPFSERYKLQRFGRGGFVSAALRTGTPIVPCAIVGAEETYPLIGNVPSLARLLGLPYAPVTPTWPWLGPLGLVPLPSKWLIEFGTPLATDRHDPSASEDPMLVFDLTDRVRQTIQQTLYALLVQRRSVFF